MTTSPGDFVLIETILTWLNSPVAFWLTGCLAILTLITWDITKHKLAWIAFSNAVALLAVVTIARCFMALFCCATE